MSSAVLGRINHHVLRRRADKLRLVPRTPALLIRHGVHVHGSAPRRYRVDHRSDYRRSANDCRGSHRRRRDRVITAATAVAVTVATTAIHLDIGGVADVGLAIAAIDFAVGFAVVAVAIAAGAIAAVAIATGAVAAAAGACAGVGAVTAAAACTLTPAIYAGLGRAA
jgi:hypothetical protein